MHPLLAGRRGFLYALAWVPVAGMLTLFLMRTGGLLWVESAVMAFSLAAAFALVSLSSWYVCRGMPLREGQELRLAVVAMVGSAAAAGLWIAVSRALAAGWSTIAGFNGLEDRMTRNENWLWAIGSLLYLLALTFHYLLGEVEATRVAKNREMQMAVMAREAELKALREQIRPHFLFNSLNSISALTSVDKAKAREMCVRLADFLRMSLSVGDRRLISLEDELSIVRNYLGVEQVRFSRMEVHEDVQLAATAELVPPLILQPLVENAVKHGIAQSLDGGVIRIEARVGENDLMIAITNSFDPDAVRSKGASVGLSNVRQRLLTIYGGGARLDVRSESGIFRAEIRMLRGQTL